MTEQTSPDDRRLFEECLRDRFDGAAGNKSLREALNWDSVRYWKTHAELVEAGVVVRGRGKGGSVALVAPPEEPQPEPKGAVLETAGEPEQPKEADIYEHALKVVRSDFVQSLSYDEHVARITAMLGRRDTGGSWSRPDIVLVARKSFVFFPHPILDLITFEIKGGWDITVKGAFEALSHRQYGTISILLFACSTEEFKQSVEADRIMEICKAHGLGLIAASDPGNFDEWDELIEPDRKLPDPERFDAAIRMWLDDGERTIILKW